MDKLLFLQGISVARFTSAVILVTNCVGLGFESAVVMEDGVDLYLRAMTQVTFSNVSVRFCFAQPSFSFRFPS